MNSESQIIRTEYSDLMKKSYIDYAMSVIISRALPTYATALNRCSGVRFTICMSWASGTTGLTENAPGS